MEQPIAPPEYPLLKRQMQELGRYPFVKIGSIGSSVCGRQLFSASLGASNEQVLFAGAFHGMEWITTMILMRFARRLSRAVCDRVRLSGEDVTALLQKRGLCIVPCVNPDGVSIQLANPEKRWQANARGVDINHNFNAGWCELRALEIESGIIGPGPTRYGGPCPESEPETQAMTRLCRRRCFCRALAFHSQGEVIYYDFGENTPPCSLQLAQKLAAAAGYQVASPEGLAVGGGFKDWFIDCLRRPAFTVEVGMGQNPLPMEQFEEIYHGLEPMLVLALKL